MHIKLQPCVITARYAIAAKLNEKPSNEYLMMLAATGQYFTCSQCKSLPHKIDRKMPSLQ